MTSSSSELLFSSEDGGSLFGGLGTGSFGQFHTVTMYDRRSGYMTTSAFLPARSFEGFIMTKHLFQCSVGSLQIDGNVNLMPQFSPLYHPAKEKNKNMSLNIN